MKRYYIGLANSCHDTSIAIVDPSGKLLFAEATERYLQSKRAWTMAPDVLHRTSALLEQFCEPGAEIVAAFSWNDEAEMHARQYATQMTELRRGMERFYGDNIPVHVKSRMADYIFIGFSHLRAMSSPGFGLDYEVTRLEGWEKTRVRKRGYEHHLTHAATGCFTSPFEEAACAVLDGYGQLRAFGCYEYKNGKVREVSAPRSPTRTGSLGIFYSIICDTCGFDPNSGEEWKVMGLASYGKHDDNLYRMLRELIQVKGLTLEPCSDARETEIAKELYKIRRKKGEPALKVADLAYAAQEVFTDVLVEYLNNLYDKNISENLVLGGGCALNSSANGRILDRTKFKNLHVFSAPADDGNAIGAALLAFQEDHPDYRPPSRVQSPYLGSKMNSEVLNNVKKFGGIKTLTECDGDAPQRAAQLLAQGKIIGWIQGSAEFGPRALGNRSILADPRPAKVKDVINSRVKFREEFRPFAPSILHEFGAKYFEHYQESPYMERTLKFRPEVIQLVPGVVHEDGTGRLQTVKREWNSRYYELIHRFYELTGVPLVLNTSFNVMGKPISHSVEDVLAVFYTSGLDAVFIDDVLIEK